MSPKLETLLDEMVGPVPPIDPDVVRARARRGQARNRRRVVAVAAIAILMVAVTVAVARQDPGTGRVEVTGSQPPASFPASAGWRHLPPPPMADGRHSAVVWTGREVLVWGGEDRSGTASATGTAYDPATDRWRALPTAPIAASAAPSAVWTGREMVVCCGTPDQGPTVDGAAYDPSTDTWRTVSERAEPAPVRYAAAVWTGSAMLVAGGQSPRSGPDPGLQSLDPDAGRWTAPAKSPAPIGQDPGVFWTGTELLIVPRLHDGAGTVPMGFTPATGAWRTFGPPPPALAIDSATAVWTGTRLLLWGQSAGPPADGSYRTAGAALDPATGVWSALPADPIGTFRSHDEGTSSSPKAVWDPIGQRMIIATGTVGADIAPHPAEAVLAFTPGAGRWTRFPDAPEGAGELVVAGDQLIAPSSSSALDLRSVATPNGSEAATGTPSSSPSLAGDQSPAPEVLDGTTGLVVIGDDGLGGAIVIDLDHRGVVRRLVQGSAAGDQPHRFDQIDGTIITGWGEIWGIGVKTATSAKITDGTIYLPGSDDTIWVANWSGGVIGAGSFSMRHVRVNGRALSAAIEPKAFSTMGAGGAVGERYGFPDWGLGALVLLKSDHGIAGWDPAADTVVWRAGADGPPGRVLDARAGYAVWTSDETTVHVLDEHGTDKVLPVVLPPGGHIASVRLSPDAALVAVAVAVDAGTRTTTSLRIIDRASGRGDAIKGDIEAPPFATGPVQWSPDGRQVLSVGWSYSSGTTTIARWVAGHDSWTSATLPLGGITASTLVTASDARAWLDAPATAPTDCTPLRDYTPDRQRPPCRFSF